MRELIKWNLDLALKAGQQPDEYGRSYEVRTRDKRLVHNIRLTNRQEYPHQVYPLIGEVRSVYIKTMMLTFCWNKDGCFVNSECPSNLDLHLYLVFRYDHVPIPDGVELERLTYKGKPTDYVFPDEYASPHD